MKTLFIPLLLLALPFGMPTWAQIELTDTPNYMDNSTLTRNSHILKKLDMIDTRFQINEATVGILTEVLSRHDSILTSLAAKEKAGDKYAIDTTQTPWGHRRNYAIRPLPSAMPDTAAMDTTVHSWLDSLAKEALAKLWAMPDSIETLNRANDSLTAELESVKKWDIIELGMILILGIICLLLSHRVITLKKKVGQV